MSSAADWYFQTALLNLVPNKHMYLVAIMHLICLHQGWQQGIANEWMACKATMDWRPFPLDVPEQSDDSVAHLALTHSVMALSLHVLILRCTFCFTGMLHTWHVRLLCESPQAMYSALATCQPPPNSFLHFFKALCLGFGS